MGMFSRLVIISYFWCWFGFIWIIGKTTITWSLSNICDYIGGLNLMKYSLFLLIICCSGSKNNFEWINIVGFDTSYNIFWLVLIQNSSWKSREFSPVFEWIVQIDLDWASIRAFYSVWTEFKGLELWRSMNNGLWLQEIQWFRHFMGPHSRRAGTWTVQPLS